MAIHINGYQPMPFSPAKVLPFPKFAATVPFANQPNISVDNSPFDIFQRTGSKSARIVLFPASSRQADSLLSNLLARRDKEAPLGYQLQWGMNFLFQALQAAFDPKDAKDEFGNRVAAFKVAEGKDAARDNLKAMKQAFVAQLEQVAKSTRNLTVVLPDVMPPGVDKATAVRELAEQAVLHGYNYNFHRQDNAPDVQLKTVTFTESGGLNSGVDAAVREGRSIGEGINLARHLVDSPANLKTTRYMSDMARSFASDTLKVNIFEKQDLVREKMGLLLSVGQGNDATDPDRDPRMAEMVYTPKDWDPATGKTVLLVGKGIIFDTGGNNLKPTVNMHRMWGDMAGAAAVMGTMKALDKLQLKGVRVIGLAAMTENRLDGRSTLMGDIHTARNGKRVQVSNTDAEGRLVMADALHYGMETYKPDIVANIATLSGGKVQAVGRQNAMTLAGNNPDLIKQVQKIETALGRVHKDMPLTDAHHQWVTKGGKGIADVYNSVDMEDAVHVGVLNDWSSDKDRGLQHSAQGAAFMREFLADPTTPWVHYDIAGAEFEAKDPRRGNHEWASGIGVKDLYMLIKGVAEGTVRPNPKKSQVIGA